MGGFSHTRYPYQRPLELLGAASRHRPVIIVGAGPIGLAAAIDLARQNIDVLVLDDNDQVSVGSRAICWSKRTLEIFDRLGVAERMLAKGVRWHVGRLFHRDKEVYAFDLLPEAGHRWPAFINLQQYYVETYLVERCQDLSERIELRWKHRAVDVSQHDDHVTVSVHCPDGDYTLEADYVLACDGANSSIRRMLGLDFAGRVFEERFLIADVQMKAEFPSERWFWFEPPFHSGRSALLHKQPDNIYRIDLQLGPDADPEVEKQPENVIPRIQAMVGEREFRLDWVSIYTFQCRRLERFVHGRVIFVGDSAHIVSPFGARGGNGGIQDVDNLCWKLAAVLRGEAGPALLESYDRERTVGADENIRYSSRSTSFMTPKSAMEQQFRDAVLDLAADLPFARKLVNSGRLSTPCRVHLPEAIDEAAGPLACGTVCPDAPVTGGNEPWLLDHLGDRFTLLHLGHRPPTCAPPGVDEITIGPEGVLEDAQGFIRQRYGWDVSVLVRPDQHVAAVFTTVDEAKVARAIQHALGGSTA